MGTGGGGEQGWKRDKGVHSRVRKALHRSAEDGLYGNITIDGVGVALIIVEGSGEAAFVEDADVLGET